MPRDDFGLKTKDLLARRVGMRCSNPNCRNRRADQGLTRKSRSTWALQHISLPPRVVGQGAMAH